MMKVSRGSKGFTLIELLIVVAIIGILAAIAIPAYTGYTAKARVTGVVNSMGAIKNALLAYYTEAGALPPAASGETAINSTYGVRPPTQYATAAGWTVTQSGTTAAVISATFQNVSGDVNTKTLTLTGDFSVNPPTWSWDGTVDNTYKPKGS
jgi:type IV pilus assembly protein PilA